MNIINNMFTNLIYVTSIVTFFSIIYYLLDKFIGKQFYFKQLKSKKKQMTIWDSLYFSIITQTTIGYGDITPISKYSRIVVCVQAFTTLLLLFTPVSTIH